MRIAVIDGQGGGIGKRIVEAIRERLPCDIEILALGTNAVATMQMLKAGANEGASGENAIVYNIDKVDIILGPIAILLPNSMLGEMTPRMAQAIADSPAIKILLPINRCGVLIAGVRDEPLPHQIEDLINKLAEKIQGKEG
ncbi:MAG TPA: DUF3842 family protein [Clostridia bacterium]|nr:DUF3842 family protein [Clostridia bacterium]